MPLVETHAGAGLQNVGFQFSGQLDHHAALGFVDHRSHQHAAAFRKPRRDQNLMIHSVEETVAEAARETLLQIELLLALQLKRLVRQRRIDRRAVGLRSDGDVFGAFQTAFNLQTSHAEFYQRIDQIVRRQILWTEQIMPIAGVTLVAIDKQIVRQPAGLGALATIGAAAAEGFARQTLPAVGHAQRAVNEHLQLHFCLRGNAADFVERQFPRDNHTLDAQLPHEFNSARFGQRHLRRAVNRQSRRDLPHQLRQTQILHNHRIGPGCDDRRDKFHGVRQFVGKNQRVERHVTAHIVPVQIIHHLRQFRECEIRGPVPGIEIRQPEIHGISPVGNRGAQRFPIAGRGEQFGAASVSLRHVDVE